MNRELRPKWMKDRPTEEETRGPLVATTKELVPLPTAQKPHTDLEQFRIDIFRVAYRLGEARAESKKVSPTLRAMRDRDLASDADICAAARAHISTLRRRFSDGQ